MIQFFIFFLFFTFWALFFKVNRIGVGLRFYLKYWLRLNLLTARNWSILSHPHYFSFIFIFYFLLILQFKPSYIHVFKFVLGPKWHWRCFDCSRAIPFIFRLLFQFVHEFQLLLCPHIFNLLFSNDIIQIFFMRLSLRLTIWQRIISLLSLHV